jgi:hypothetical protein
VIHARIQGHPSRAHLHGDLAAALDPLPCEVCLHSSDPPDPWAGYRACLRGIPPGASHLLVIQDDAQPCVHVPVALEQVAARNPDVPVCLFLGAAPASTAGLARKAMMRNVRYVPLMNTTFVPLVAVLWPVQVAQRFLEWSDTARRMTRADDGNAARFMRHGPQQFLVSVPSLVEHNDFVPSVKGGPSRPRQHKPGKSWRHACLLAEDALAYEW